eukprot:1959669-Pyramimonas_sp.AAC.1
MEIHSFIHEGERWRTEASAQEATIQRLVGDAQEANSEHRELIAEARREVADKASSLVNCIPQGR